MYVKLDKMIKTRIEVSRKQKIKELQMQDREMREKTKVIYSDQ